MDLSRLSDEALLGKVEALAETERFSLIDLLLHLGELDLRCACQNRGYASVFAYLTRRLGYAESDAIRRVRTARAVRKYPSILRMLARGELHLVSVAMLEPLLTSENHERLLRLASRRSTREVERLVADLSPASMEPRDRIRPLSALPSPPPLAFAQRRVVFTFAASEQVRHWFDEARDLLRHRFPMGRMEEVIGEALRRLAAQARPAKPSPRAPADPDAAASDEGRSPPSRRRSEGKAPPGPKPAPPAARGNKKPAAASARGRYIPKWVKDEFWRRDAGRCAYAGPDGTRCGETAWLEWDHIIPWALGGPSHDPANIRLLCRAHNQTLARRSFGEAKPSAAMGSD
ncbi:MAG: HNH endonuclease signature motif containing protein [Elusimicrobia bacterium]|nr:HNH endonuclease signature motif containing protein [Elusimicrobiota bacterium]